MTESQDWDDQLIITDNGLRCTVTLEHGPRKISKRFILLVTCLSALCDCLLLSVIGMFGQFIFSLYSASMSNSQG